MGKIKKKILDVDMTNLDYQDRASFFCPPKRKEEKSKSTSDRELELSSTEAYDKVYQAKSNLSTVPPPKTNNYMQS